SPAEGSKSQNPYSCSEGIGACAQRWKLLSTSRMRKRQSSFKGDRPLCPFDPNHTVHRHGSYERWANCDDGLLQIILRFLCTFCLHTISVLPDDVLPYRAVSVPLLEKDLDARVNGTPPPPATVNEKGCLKRA